MTGVQTCALPILYVNAEPAVSTPFQNQNETEDEHLEREMREYIKRQEREARARANVPTRSRPATRFPSGFGLGTNQFQVTKWLMGLTIVFFIAGILFAPFLLINLGNIIFIFPLFTAMLTIPLLSFFSLITVIFSLLILYGLGRQIELRFGPKYLLTMYIISGLAGGILVVVSLLLIYVGFPSFASPQQYVSTQYAPILCLVTFFIYLVGLDREMTFFLFFIPVRLKAKYILIFLLIINIIYAILGDLGSLASLMGMLVGKLYYNS